MNTLDLILEYKNLIDTTSGLTINTTPVTDSNLTSIIEPLEGILANTTEFNTVKSLILHMDAYPIYIHCAKLYPTLYANYFVKDDESNYTKLLSYLADLMIYYSSVGFEILKETSLMDINIDITDIDTIFNNKLIALSYYNAELFEKIYNDAIVYYNNYLVEKTIFDNLTDLQFINGFFKLFSKGCTYHFKYKLINKLYLYLDGSYKDTVRTIIDFALETSNKDILFFEEDFKDLDIAYKFKNK